MTKSAYPSAARSTVTISWIRERGGRCAKLIDEVTKRGFRPFDIYAHSGRRIENIAGEFKLAREVVNERPEPDTLHDASNRYALAENGGL